MLRVMIVLYCNRADRFFFSYDCFIEILLKYSSAKYASCCSNLCKSADLLEG